MNLKNKLISLFNKNKYKIIVFSLIGLTLLFLFCGNYNLVESMTMNEMSDNLNASSNKTSIELDNMNDVAEHYSNENDNRKDSLDKEFKIKEMVEPFIEGMHHCGSNFSNIGVEGNKANIIVNSQCEGLKQIKNKNKNLL
tara:strand:+ start:1069 stop:1488 length:420 start_codon:yes stop_codon:yes gene_type:complete